MPYEEKRITGGLNVGATADAIPDNELADAVGCWFIDAGGVESEPGAKTIRSYVSESTVNGFGEATLGGRTYMFTKVGSNVYRDDTLIASDWDNGGRLWVAGYNDYAYLSDGVTQKRYSLDKGLENIGFSTPTAAPTEDSNGATGGLLTGTYQWAYTFYNGVAESNMSPVLKLTDIEAGVKDEITLGVPVGPAGTTERRIYRTILNGSAMFRVGKIEDNTTTTFLDEGGLPPDADPEAALDETDELREERWTLPEIARTWPQRFPIPSTAAADYEPEQFGQDVWVTNLGVLADWTDHDPPPTDLTSMILHRDTFYGISGNNLRFTRTAAPEYWSDYFSIPIGRQTGETLQAIVPLDDHIICYTTASIYRFTRLGAEARESRLEATNAPVGVVGPNAVTPVFAQGGRTIGHIFLARDGLYLFDGQDAVRISQKLDKLFFDPAQEHRFYSTGQSTATMGTIGDRIYLSYSTTGRGNTRTLLIDLREPSNPRYSVSLRVYDLFVRSQNGSLLAGRTRDIMDLREDTPISTIWRLTTRHFPIRGSTTLESMERVKIDADVGGVPTTVTVATDTGNQMQFTINGSGRKLHTKLVPTTLKGNNVRVKLESTGSARRALYAVAFGYDEEPAGGP